MYMSRTYLRVSSSSILSLDLYSIEIDTRNRSRLSRRRVVSLTDGQHVLCYAPRSVSNILSSLEPLCACVGAIRVCATVPHKSIEIDTFTAIVPKFIAVCSNADKTW